MEKTSQASLEKIGGLITLTIQRPPFKAVRQTTLVNTVGKMLHKRDNPLS